MHTTTLHSTPTVSVVLSTYNRASFIAETLHSILRQTYSPFEVIVVDDGSEDQTGEIISQLFPQVRYLRIENSGQMIALNLGASIATATHLAFCDSDDLWRPDHLEQHFRLRALAPDVEYSFSNFCIIRESQWSNSSKFDSAPPHYWGSNREIVDKNIWVYHHSLYDRLIAFQPIFPSAIVMSKAFFDRIGGWNEAVNRIPGLDFEMHLRCVSHPPTGVIALPTVGIRKHSDNFSGNAIQTLLGECKILEYVASHHAIGRIFADTISGSIHTRKIQAIDCAFTRHEFDKVKDIFSGLDKQRYIPFTTRFKNYLAGISVPIRDPVATVMLAAGSLRRNINA